MYNEARKLYFLHWQRWIAFGDVTEKLRMMTVITPAVFFSYLMLGIAVAVFGFKSIEDLPSKKIRKHRSQRNTHQASTVLAPGTGARWLGIKRTRALLPSSRGGACGKQVRCRPATMTLSGKHAAYIHQSKTSCSQTTERNKVCMLSQINCIFTVLPDR